MKYSLPFYTTNPYLNKVDELTIKFQPSQKDSLPEFLNEHKNQRIVLCIPNYKDFTQKIQDFISGLAADNIVLRFEEDALGNITTPLPHFFNYYCSEMEQFFVLSSLGVSDIYITNNLGYFLSQIKEDFKGNIRFFPNIAQSSISISNPETKFFIRPEDMNIYEPYIDYIEFYTSDLEWAAELYKIYAIDKKYDGRLSKIIEGAPQDIYNGCVQSTLAAERLNCLKMCSRGVECNICKGWFNIARTLHNKQFVIKVKDD